MRTAPLSHSSRALAAVTAVLLIVAALLTISTGTATAAKSCGLEFQPDGRVQVQPPTIWIEVLVICDEPPASHNLTLLLQRRDTDGSWVTQSAQASPAIPNPRLTLRASAECRAGLWRGMVHVTGSLQSNDFTFTDVTTPRLVSTGDC
ncbi:hypothetical protein [Nocardia otitidiscaviarum]|uniref:hypothetical protein n=1 Tax=Nocardia otitidiscaviarum TaxID=1823 RepID=UPI002455ECF8|nr:hypothetical protein [Nocardia otitidiscaviarum]